MKRLIVAVVFWIPCLLFAKGLDTSYYFDYTWSAVPDFITINETVEGEQSLSEKNGLKFDKVFSETRYFKIYLRDKYGRNGDDFGFSDDSLEVVARKFLHGITEYQFRYESGTENYYDIRVPWRFEEAKLYRPVTISVGWQDSVNVMWIDEGQEYLKASTRRTEYGAYFCVIIIILGFLFFFFYPDNRRYAGLGGALFMGTLFVVIYGKDSMILFALIAVASATLKYLLYLPSLKAKKGIELWIKKRQEALAWQRKPSIEKTVEILRKKIEDFEKKKSEFQNSGADFIAKAIAENERDQDEVDALIRKYKAKLSEEELVNSLEYQRCEKLLQALQIQKTKLDESKKLLLKFFNQIIAEMGAKADSLAHQISIESLNAEAREKTEKILRTAVQREKKTQEHLDRTTLQILNRLDSMANNALEAEIVSKTRKAINSEYSNFSLGSSEIDNLLVKMTDLDETNEFSLDEYGKIIQEKMDEFQNQIKSIGEAVDEVAA